MDKMIYKTIGIITVFLFYGVFPVNAYNKRDILYRKTKAINLSSTLIMDNSWINFPSYSDRAFWSEIPEKLAEKYIEKAEESEPSKRQGSAH